jgi:hypothetical protein
VRLQRKTFNRTAAALQWKPLPQVRMRGATRRVMWRLIPVCVLTTVASTAAAQVYECTNAKGVKEFAQFCPPGTVQQRQVGKSGDSGGDAGAVNPAGAGSPAPKSIEVQDVEFKQRMLERQEAETKAAQEKERADESERNCAEARAQLQAVLDGQRLERFDPATGERIRLGDDERADEAERQRQAVTRWCK